MGRDVELCAINLHLASQSVDDEGMSAVLGHHEVGFAVEDDIARLADKMLRIDYARTIIQMYNSTIGERQPIFLAVSRVHTHCGFIGRMLNDLYGIIDPCLVGIFCITLLAFLRMKGCRERLRTDAVGAPALLAYLHSRECFLREGRRSDGGVLTIPEQAAHDEQGNSCRNSIEREPSVVCRLQTVFPFLYFVLCVVGLVSETLLLQLLHSTLIIDR